jgi:hypothetical protein
LFIILISKGNMYLIIIISIHLLNKNIIISPNYSKIKNNTMNKNIKSVNIFMTKLLFVLSLLLSIMPKVEFTWEILILSFNKNIRTIMLFMLMMLLLMKLVNMFKPTWKKIKFHNKNILSLIIKKIKEVQQIIIWLCITIVNKEK